MCGLMSLMAVAIAALFAAAPSTEGRKLSVESQRALGVVTNRSAKPEERIRAVDKIAKSKEPAAVIPLVSELTTTDGDLKAAIQRALDALEAVRVLSEDLASSSPETRLRAAQLLALVPRPSGVDPLIRALSDPEPKVREASASALFRFRDRKAVVPLIGVLAKDAAPDTRSAAAQSLGKLGGPQAIEALEQALKNEKDEFVKVLIQKSLAEAKTGGS